MSSPYTPVTLVGFNAVPPPDDGSEVASNQLDWDFHLDKIGTPLKDLAEGIDTNVQTAFQAVFGQTTSEADASATPTDYSRRFPVVIDVTRFGADPTGATDSTAAIQTAIAVAEEALVTGNTGVFGSFAIASGSAPMVFFPAGVYTITGSLTDATTNKGRNYIQYVGDNAMLVDTGQTVTCFDDIRHRVRFIGLSFRGFATQIGIDTGNVTTTIDIINCEGIDPANNCVLTSSNSASTHLRIKDSHFQTTSTSAVLFDIDVDRCEMEGCWVQTSSDITFQVRNRMRLTKCTCIPSGASHVGQTWVELAAGATGFWAHECHFGGEAAGRQIVRNYADALTTSPLTIISLQNNEQYNADQMIELFALPNLIICQNNRDEIPTNPDEQIKVDSSVTDAQIKTWLRYGRVIIDRQSGQSRFWGHDTVETIADIKHRKENPQPIYKKTIPLDNIVASGDMSSGFGPAGNCAPSAGTNEYGATTQIFTANDDDDNCSISDTNFLVPTELTKRVYTYVHEITWAPNNDIGTLEILIDAGYERYKINLQQGTNVVSVPFLYMNGGGSPDTDLDRIFIQTGARMKSGDVLTFGRWFLAQGDHTFGEERLVMSASATPPSAHFGSTGPNASFFICDEIIDTGLSSGNSPGWMATTAGDDGTQFVALGNMA